MDIATIGTEPITETTTTVEYGIKQWAVNYPVACSLGGWWPDRETAEKVLADCRGENHTDVRWDGMVVRRTTVHTVTVEAV